MTVHVEVRHNGPRQPDFDDEPLYAPARKVYPRKVTGYFRRLKWTALVITLSIYYLLPFVRWTRTPGEPTQAVLVDLEHRRFYFFFIELWPQEVYFFTGLLILAALTLFMMNAVAGRVWCGYLCWQTVWTDLFMAVERWVEGDRRERIQKDSGPMTVRRVGEKALKHGIWLAIAWWTGGAWVLYFADAPTLVKQLATFSAPPIAYYSIGILTFTTYVFAGHMREQVCLYMCPWPRIQAALTDENALNVSYRYDRGEPRNSLKKARALQAAGERSGDCIDCTYCVEVCPTGVDIRNGPNLGCIQCGLCIDACDSVMAKIGRPPRLIAYDTDVNIRRHAQGLPSVYRFVRPRTILYAVIITLVAGVMLFALLGRNVNGVALIHDRNPLYVELSDGSISNGFAVRVVNKSSAPKRYTLSVAGLEGAKMEIVGAERGADGAQVVEVGPDQTREVRMLLTTADPPKEEAHPIVVEARDESGAPVAAARDFFHASP